jgi:hypothetical protein
MHFDFLRCSDTADRFQPTTAKMPGQSRKSWQITQTGDGHRRQWLSRLPRKQKYKSVMTMSKNTGEVRAENTANGRTQVVAVCLSIIIGLLSLYLVGYKLGTELAFAWGIDANRTLLA